MTATIAIALPATPPPAPPVANRLESLIDTAVAVLTRAAIEAAPARLSSSLGLEDMVLTDLIWRHELPIEIFTLDTGRLHPETLEHLAAVEAHYGRRMQVWFPQAAAVEEWVSLHGINGFYQSKPARTDCCHVRKVEPLGRALAGAGTWITGLRRTQSTARQDLPLRERDEARGLDKLNPLLDWTESDVADYLALWQVPVNALHARGFPSIGCAPCTRAVAPGEDPRAGRWWWEQDTIQECGLHVGPDGRLVRTRGNANQSTKEIR